MLSITPNNNTQSQNFKGHYVLQVSKNAFEPLVREDFNRCNKLFKDEFYKYVPKSNLPKILKIFIKEKFELILENVALELLYPSLKKK